MSERLRVALVGARGYVGRELVQLLAGHPSFELAFATSSSEAGRPVADVMPGAPSGLAFSAAEPERLGEADVVDVVVLALPNGESERWVAALPARARIVDLGADHRFDDAWVYGQPERRRDAIRGARRVANPGCYATALQLAVEPLLPVVDGVVHAFGVSGYSGAGATPSPRNDPETLRDNLMPYALVGHMHEREVSRQLSHEVRLLPHVAPFFRGVTVTVSFTARSGPSRDELVERLRARYADEALVKVTEAAPLVRDIAGSHEVRIGGLTVSDDGRSVALVATIDNLLGGAATQALRNMNLMTGQHERAGISSGTGPDT